MVFLLQRILIFANGNLPDIERARSLLSRDDYILCADGGTRHALALGVRPNLVLGDMDSLEKDHWEKLQESGVDVEIFPRDKDETDLELAIHTAIEMNPREIVILAALGGRVDQTLANIALLTDPRLAAFDVRLDDGVEEIFLCRDQAWVHGKRGEIVSLIPWGAPVVGVQTEQLKWPLNKETLHPDKTRGISNEMLAGSAAVTIESGLLLIVHLRDRNLALERHE